MKKVVLGIAIVLSATSNGMSNDDILRSAGNVISKTGDTCNISISQDFRCDWDINVPDTSLVFDLNGHNFFNCSHITAKDIVFNNVGGMLNNTADEEKAPIGQRNHIVSQGDTCSVSFSQDFQNDWNINLPNTNLIFDLNGHKFSNHGRIYAKSITIKNGPIEMGNGSIIDAISNVNIESEQIENL